MRKFEVYAVSKTSKKCYCTYFKNLLLEKKFPYKKTKNLEFTYN